MTGVIAGLSRWIEDHVLLPEAVSAVKEHTRDHRPVWHRLPNQKWQRLPAPDSPSRWSFLRHAARHPDQYFMCASCGDGPWHCSWEEPDKKSRHALGGCCSGAD